VFKGNILKNTVFGNCAGLWEMVLNPWKAVAVLLIVEQKQICLAVGTASANCRHSLTLSQECNPCCHLLFLLLLLFWRVYYYY